jgi:serine/threonine protein kinase
VELAETLPVGHAAGGRYVVQGLLGQGGMGAVYEVEERGSGRRLAMKAPLAGIDGNSEGARRFVREANATRLLDHPNLVAAVDLVIDDGRLFLVMELARGGSLADALSVGPLAPRRALVIARQVLAGVGHAHAAGFVHRDLKPENVMLVQAGEPGREWEQAKILDFGLVKLVGDAESAFGADKLTRTGVVFGTPAYMAPEQALGRVVDGRADLYAVGVMIFEMLTGKQPFAARDPMAQMRMQVSVAAPRLAATVPGAPWATGAMEMLVFQALAKRPADRYANAAAMIDALDEAFLSIQSSA